jgi:hypothetical protein
MIFTNTLLQLAPQPVEGIANLTGQQWLVRLWWSARLNDGAGGWLVDLLYSDGSAIRTSDTDGNALPRGTLVVPSMDLWETYRYLPTFPPGRLAAYRADGGDAPPGLYELGSEFLLEYVEPVDEET